MSNSDSTAIGQPTLPSSLSTPSLTPEVTSPPTSTTSRGVKRSSGLSVVPPVAKSPDAIPNFYLTHSPLSLNENDYVGLIAEWQRVNPHHLTNEPFTQREIALLIQHFTQNRLFYNELSDQWLYADLHAIHEGAKAVAKVCELTVSWLSGCLKTLETRSSQLLISVSSFLTPIIKSISSNRARWDIISMLKTVLISSGAGKGPLAPDEIPVRTRTSDGILEIKIYSMSSGTLRLPLVGEDIFAMPNYEMRSNFSLDQMTMERLRGSKFWRIVTNFFRGTEFAEEKVEFFGRWMSYQLLMDNPEQIYTWWTGASGTGKSLFIDLMSEIRGFAGSVRLDQCVYQKGTNNPTANYQRTQLQGKSFSYCSELNEGYTVDGAKLKADTDVIITARQARENAIHFPRTHSHIFLGNDYPVIHDESNSIGRRGIHITTRGERYKGEQTSGIHREILKNEMEEIFYFIKLGFDGIRQFKGINPPEEFALISLANKIDVAEDWFKVFWAEAVGSGVIELGDDYELTTQDLYTLVFRPWWARNYPKGKSDPGSRVVGKQVRSAGLVGASRESNGKTYYKGMRLGEVTEEIKVRRVRRVTEDDIDRIRNEEV